MRILVAIFTLLILLTPTPALAVQQSNLNLAKSKQALSSYSRVPWTSEQIAELQQIDCGWKTTNQLLLENLISVAEATKIKASYATKLKSIAPELDSYDIAQINFAELIKERAKANNFEQSLRGLFSFTNIVATVSSFLLAIAITWLISLYLLPILKLIPLMVYETVLYVLVLATLLTGLWLDSAAIYQYVVLSGCLSLIGILGFSYWQHRDSWQQFWQKIGLDVVSGCSLILFLIWTTVAIAYQNVAIAFLAIIALEAFWGFAVAVMPLTYAISFRDRAVIPKTMLLSLILLTTYVIAQITNTSLPYLAIFAPGVKYISSLVYFIGLLIVSSKWYFPRNLNLYWLMQGITIISGGSALYVSSVWQIAVLKGVSGTLFSLYAIEKYFELPWTKKTWAWGMFGFSILLYVCVWLIRSYPELFLIG